MTTRDELLAFLRYARGLPAYLLVIYVPLPRRIWFALLPYAGDWAYREDRRALMKE